MNASYDELVAIQDIGDILSTSIVNYFKDEKNIQEINDLIELGVNTKYESSHIEEDERVSGKRFVITGSFDFITRDEIKRMIEDRGGNTSSSVSSKTDVVIVGDEPGKKYDDALRFGITIWRESELKEFIDE